MFRFFVFAILLGIPLAGQSERPAEHSYLGVGVRALSGEAGVEITQIEKNSPAAKAGLQIRDVVLEYNAQSISGGEEFSRLVRGTPAGRTVTLQISRNGSRRTLVATIAARQTGARRMHRGNARIPSYAPVPGRPEFGIEGEALQGQLARFFGVTQGILVRKVAVDSAAARWGLRAGDVIVSIGGIEVAAPRDLAEVFYERRTGEGSRLGIVRERKSMILESPGDRQTPRP